MNVCLENTERTQQSAGSPADTSEESRRETPLKGKQMPVSGFELRQAADEQVDEEAAGAKSGEPAVPEQSSKQSADGLDQHGGSGQKRSSSSNNVNAENQ